MTTLTGHTPPVTGASAGIGTAITEVLARAGAAARLPGQQRGVR